MDDKQFKELMEGLKIVNDNVGCAAIIGIVILIYLVSVHGC